MRKKIILFLAMATLAACGKKEAERTEGETNVHSVQLHNSETVVEKAGSSAADIKVELIDKLPDNIEGCGCHYSIDETTYLKLKFIYADNRTDAYMNLNGKLEHFKIPESGDGTMMSNINYKLLIASQRVGDLDEGGLFKGTIRIERNDGAVKIVDFYGDCGC